MKLITRFELVAKTESGLFGLLHHSFNHLAMSDPDTTDRCNALASIENIQREIASRAPCP